MSLRFSAMSGSMSAVSRRPGGLDDPMRNAGPAARRAQGRELGAATVTALFRLTKLATLHAMDNQAVARQVDETAAMVAEYGRRTEHNVSLLFARGSVLVGGLLLRANRGVYEGALELGDMLARVGASELTVQKDATAQDLHTFAAALAEALRGPRPSLPEYPAPRVRLRALRASTLDREMAVERSDLEAEASKIARAYASSIVVMRRFYEALRRGRYELPQRVKRIAQRLVDLSAGQTPAFLGVTAARNANHDDAGRAVNTAILALAMTRQVTSDAVLLVRVAMAALLHDAGRARLAGVAGREDTAIVPRLSEVQEAESPRASAAVLLALGGVNEPSTVRAVTVYEAHALRQEPRIGPAYRGMHPVTLAARILASARAFNDRLTPMPGLEPATADEAIAELERVTTDAMGRTVLRLLVGALGIFPTGTLVELSTGEIALVVRTAADPSRYSEPRVRLVFDAAGGALARPVEIDLADKAGDVSVFIRRVVATSDDASAASLRELAQSPEPPRGKSGSGIRAGERTSPDTLGPAPFSAVQRVPRSDVSEDMATRPTMRPKLEPKETARPTATTQREIVIPRFPSNPPREAASAPTSARMQPPSSALPAPTAQGGLAKTPLVHLLVYMLDQRLTGTTVFEDPDRTTHVVYFEHGVPSKIRTGQPIAPLDRVIAGEGLLDEETLRGTLLEVSKKGRLHGRHLVSLGLLEGATVLRMLRLQLVQKMTHLFELPKETTYAYYQGENFLAEYGGPELTPCEPLALIMAGIRLRAKDPIVNATLERLASRPLGLHPEAELKRFELLREEASVSDLLRAKRMSLSELLGSGVGREGIVRTMVYALTITRCLDLGVPGRPPVGLGGAVVGATERPRATSPLPSAPAPNPTPVPASRAAPTPPPPPPPARPTSAPVARPTPPPGSIDFAARRAEIEERARTIEEKDYFEVLGVSREANADLVQSAYFGLAKTWHPDRVPLDLADVKPLVARIFARLNEAFQCLSDESKRTAYIDSLGRGAVSPDDEEKVALAMEAAMASQKAEVLLKKHDLPNAEALAQRAVQLDPDQPEYLTQLVWIQAMKRGDPPPMRDGAASTHFDDLIRTLDMVIAKEPRYERALFYRASLSKRAGRHDKALRDFRLVAEMNPKNIDAVREVRLFEMRKRGAPEKSSTPPPEGASGLLGKLWKR